METIKNLTLVYSFVKVAQFKSFTKAADELGISRSQLSKAVKELETNLGQALFKRNTRYVDFTDFGRNYFHICENQIEEIESFTKKSKENIEVPKEKFRITLAGAYGEDIIAPVISKILMNHPEIEAELVFSTEIIDITSGEFDLAIRVTDKRPTKGHAIQIADRKEYIVASPSYLQKYGTPKRPKDLSQHNCLSGSNPTWSFKSSEGRQRVRISGNFKSTNARATMNAAIQGLGICRLPSVYLEEHIRNKSLTPILENYTEEPVPIWALTPSRKLITPAVKLFLKEFDVF